MIRIAAQTGREHRDAQRQQKILQATLSKYKSTAVDIKRVLKEVSSALHHGERIASLQSPHLQELLSRSVGGDNLAATRLRLNTPIGALQQCKRRLMDLEVKKRSHLLILNGLKSQLRGILGWGMSTSQIQSRIDEVDFTMSTTTMGRWREWYCLEEIKELNKRKKLASSLESLVAVIEKDCQGDGIQYAARMWTNELYLVSDDIRTCKQVVDVVRKENELVNLLANVTTSSLMLRTLSAKVPPGCAALIRMFSGPLLSTHGGKDHDEIASKEYQMYFQSSHVMSCLEEAQRSVMPASDEDDSCYCCGCPMCSGRDDLWLGPRKAEKDRELFWGSLQSAKWRNWCWGA